MLSYEPDVAHSAGRAVFASAAPSILASMGCLVAADVSRGIRLHVGAMCHSWFVLQPYTGAPDAASLVRLQDIEAAMDDRLPAIREAVQYQ